MDSSSGIRRGAVVCGSLPSTGAGSILSMRHTVAASARANTASGSSSSRSASSASSFLTGTFKETANTATCRPAASRAWRSSAPALGCAAAASAENGPPGLGCTGSLIESPLLIRHQLRRLGKTPLQLIGQLQHGLPIVHAALDLDTQPQRL